MKTLNQILEKKGFSKKFTTENLETFNEIKLIKKAFKEWLQQKKRENGEKYIVPLYSQIGQAIQEAENEVFDELLEELKWER